MLKLDCACGRISELSFAHSSMLQLPRRANRVLVKLYSYMVPFSIEDMFVIGSLYTLVPFVGARIVINAVSISSLPKSRLYSRVP